MNNVMAVVFTEDRSYKLDRLNDVRALSAIPFGGRYRIIDFTLSNLVNSGVTNVGVTTQYKYHSLIDHLMTGKPWDLSRKNYGMFVLPPNLMKEIDLSGIRNNTNVLKGIESYINHSEQEYVFIIEANSICNINLKDLYNFHLDNEADVSIVYYKEKTLERKQQLIDEIEIDKNGNVKDIYIRPKINKSINSCLGIYLMKKTLLQELVEEQVTHNRTSNVIDVIVENLDKLKVMGYEFKGYAKRITDVNTYYESNMDLLNYEIRKELFLKSSKIMTKVKDNVPTIHHKGCKCSNSLIANGCNIKGEVKNSILFRGVTIEEGARVENCIIMQDTYVGKNAVLEHVIMDKDCVISEDRMLVGQPQYPFVIGKGENI